MTRSDYRQYLSQTLWAGAGLLVVAAVALLLWWWLKALGDQAGADGARGVAAVAFACWCLDFVTLVVLLAWGEISGLRDTGEVADRSAGRDATPDVPRMPERELPRPPAPGEKVP